MVDLPTRLAPSNNTAYLSEYKFFHSNSLSYAFLLKYISTSKYAPLNLFHPLYHKCTFLQYLHPVLCVFLQSLYLKPCAFLQNVLSCRFIFSYLINCTINQKFKKSYTYHSCRTLLNRFFQNFLERQGH